MRHLVPPILIDLAVALTRRRIGFTGYYTSFMQAADLCSGYDVGAVASAYRSRAAHWQPSSLDVSYAGLLSEREIRFAGAVAVAACALIGKHGRSAGLHVVDVGGGYGIHHPVIARVLGSNLRAYTIVETPGVVAAMSGEGDTQVRWLDTSGQPLSEAVSKADVVVSSSALQYFADPLATLSDWAHTAGLIVLDRIPVVPHHRNFVAIQNARYSGKRVTYPAWFFGEECFERMLLEAGLSIIVRWLVPEDSPFVLGARRPYSGFVLSANQMT